MKRTPLKRGRKPLRPVSDRQRASQARLRAQYDELLARSGGVCEVRFSPYCSGVGSAPHHVLRRSLGGNDHHPALLLWSCWPCNQGLEDAVGPRLSEAYARALLIHSWEHERLNRLRAEYVPVLARVP